MVKIRYTAPADLPVNLRRVPRVAGGIRIQLSTACSICADLTDLIITMTRSCDTPTPGGNECVVCGNGTQLGYWKGEAHAALRTEGDGPAICAMDCDDLTNPSPNYATVSAEARIVCSQSGSEPPFTCEAWLLVTVGVTWSNMSPAWACGPAFHGCIELENFESLCGVFEQDIALTLYASDCCEMPVTIQAEVP
jgi:hypothetical protein